MSKDSSVVRKSMYMHVPVHHHGTEGTSTVTVHVHPKSGKENPYSTSRMALALA